MVRKGKDARVGSPRWTRRKELLVVFPAPRHQQPESKWLALCRDLTQGWRVFWAYPPRKGEVVPAGQAGLDPITLDTLPSIRRVIAEQLVSAVILVGESVVREYLASLHSFAAHIPYLVVLTEPWTERIEEEEQSDPGRLEFTLGLAERILLTDDSIRPSLEPLLRRLRVPVETIPDPRRRSEWARFVEKTSRGVQTMFLRKAAESDAGARVDVIAVLGDEDLSLCERRIAEWRQCLPSAQSKSFLVPMGVPGLWSKGAKELWPSLNWLMYKDAEHAVVAANRALASGSGEFVLFLTPSARLQPSCLDQLVATARKLPLVGAVGAQCPDQPVPGDWSGWAAFAFAWSLKFKGAYSVVPHVRDDCFLMRRAVLESVGGFDPRLGWTFAVRDLCLRMRQAGFHLFRAEDAVADCPAAGLSMNGDTPRRCLDAFMRKWNVVALSPIKEAFR